MDFLKKFQIQNKFTTLLMLLLATDLFYICLHAIHIIATDLDINAAIRSDAFRISRDRALGESFQYVKEYWISLILAWFIFKQRKYIFSGWALLFLYLLFDDMFQLHELFAESILEKMGRDPSLERFGLRYQDFGEL